MSLLHKAELAPARLFTLPLITAITIGNVILTVQLISEQTCGMGDYVEPRPPVTVEIVDEPAPVKLVIDPPAITVEPACNGGCTMSF